MSDNTSNILNLSSRELVLFITGCRQTVEKVRPGPFLEPDVGAVNVWWQPARCGLPVASKCLADTENRSKARLVRLSAQWPRPSWPSLWMN